MTQRTFLRTLSYLSCWIGLLVFVTGGLIYKNEHTFFEISDFGWFFLPLASLYLFHPATRTHVQRHFDHWQSIATRNPIFVTIGLGITMLLLFVSQTWGIFNRYASFRGDWDLAIYANACANRLHSSLRDDASLLADHFEPLLALFIPFCEHFDPAIVLLTAQSLSLVAGGVAIFLLARALKVNELLAIVLAALYVNFPGNSTTLRYDFHLLALGMGTLPWLIYLAYRKRWWWFFTLSCLHIALKENASLTIAGIGGLLLFRQRRTAGLLTFCLGCIAFLLVMKFAFPYFRDGKESLYFQKYYGHLGSSLEDMSITLVTKPIYVLSQILTVDRIVYLLKLLLPFVFIPFYKPALLLPVLPAVGINIMSNNSYLFGGGFHYQAEIYPLLFATTIWALKEQTRYQKLFSYWILFLSICCSGKGLFTYARTYAPNEEQKYLARKLNTMKAELGSFRVSAIEKVATHLSSLPHLYLLDQIDHADMVVIAYPQTDKKLWQYSQHDIETKIIPDLLKHADLYYQDGVYKEFRIYQIKRP